MPCGTRSAVSTNPATTSFGSHSRRYDASTATPGTAATFGRFIGGACHAPTGRRHPERLKTVSAIDA
jgi:hypothetical protein